MVDTSLVEIDEDLVQGTNHPDSSLELLDAVGKNTSTLGDNIPLNSSDKSFDSKEKSLLPVDDSAARKNPIDQPETNEHSPSDSNISVEKDSAGDGGNSMRECETPVCGSSVEIQEGRRISLDGSSGKGRIRLDIEEDEISEDRDVSSVLKLVQEPDLSPELFETLWGELPEA